jgi:hypothetical protein
MQIYRAGIIAAALGLASLGAAAAEELRPLQGQSIGLGEVSGVAYYTVEPNGFHVVATLAQPDEAATPMRIETVLAEGQSVTLSTPGGVDVRPGFIEISRQNDQVLVHKSGSRTNFVRTD